MTLHDLQSYRITTLPPGMYYISSFISEDEERHILQEIPENKYITLTHRRLQAWPSKLSAKNTLLAAPLPAFLKAPILERFDALTIFHDTPHNAPNHVLLNEYPPNTGIAMHEDGPAYAPVVATVSLGGSVVLDLVEKNTASTSDEEAQEPKKWRVLQEPRSLLVTHGAAYTDMLHGIASVDVDEDLRAETVANWDLLGKPDGFATGRNERTTTRISLTYRDVLRVSLAAGKILGAGRK